MYVKVVASLTYLIYVGDQRAVHLRQEGLEGGGGTSSNAVGLSHDMNLSDGDGLGPLHANDGDYVISREDLSTYCDSLDRYSVAFLCLLLVVVAVGLSLNLFVIVVISWYPDLYTSKHLGQAYTLLSNMASLASASFIVLSSFVPSENSCSLVLVLSFGSTALFLVSEATLQEKNVPRLSAIALNEIATF